MVKIGIVGTGYVGLVTGTCLAEIGHDVICSDVCKEKIEMLKRGEIPIFEKGLEELVHRNVSEKRLKFTTDVGKAIRESDAIFSAVGTPPDENHKADLRFVREVAKTFAENLNSYKIFANKSTVPVGTGEMVKEIITGVLPEDKLAEFDVVSNPEFLREGQAVWDSLNPERIVVGTESAKARQIMEKIYGPYESKSSLIFTDIKSAELIKYASNSFLAAKISFINEMARYCELVGADVEEVSKGMGLDSRIGSKFLNAGIGYGGSCFPKDVDALIESGKEAGYTFRILEAGRDVNYEQKGLVVEKLKEKIGNLDGKTITLWGLAFKPGTDDIREAPSHYIISELLKSGAKVRAYDPIAEEAYKKQHPSQEVDYHPDKYEALEDSDCLVLVTEWDEFRFPHYDEIRKKMNGNLIVDGRNMYDPKDVSKEGFEYVGIGRKE